MTKTKPEVYEIDILQMELDKKLPHWLDWTQRYPDKADAIRKKHRDKWLAEQKQKKRTKAFQAAKVQAQATLDRTRAFDPSQPRDEEGKWTDGGGDGGGGGSDGGTGAAAAEQSASTLLKPETVTSQQLFDKVPGSEAKHDAARAKLAKGVPTDAPVAQGGFKRPDGSYTPERFAAHFKILANTFTLDAIAAATPKPGEKPVLHLLGGRGGSGKSWFVGPKGTVDKSKSIYLNNDDVKAALPGYEGWNAALMHEESSDVGNTAEKLARDLKLNVILDGTMRTASSLEKRIEAYKKAGYRVEGHYMYTSPAKSAERALQRFVRGGETGRFVSPQYSLGSTTNEASFDKASSKMDAWEIYDNDVDGRAPKFHAASKKK